MPLNTATLTDLIVQEMESRGMGADNPSEHEKLAAAIAEAVFFSTSLAVHWSLYRQAQALAHTE